MARALAKNRYRYGQSPVDLATPVHFALGLIAGVMGVSPLKATIVATTLKIGIVAAEQGMGHALFSRAPGDSNINTLVDLLAEIGGVSAGARIRSRWAPAPVTPAV